MAIVIESRTAAETMHGGLMMFMPDGMEYAEGKVVSATEAPTFEEALEHGLCLGMIDTYKWGVEYKTLTKKGYSRETQRWETSERKSITKVKPTFTTQDVNPEALALEYGLAVLPKATETARPFSNVSGQIRGWLYVQVVDALRTNGEDGEVAQVYMRGDLGLADSPEHNDDLMKISYDFNVTKLPEDGFKNIALPTELK